MTVGETAIATAGERIGWCNHGLRCTLVVAACISDASSQPHLGGVHVYSFSQVWGISRSLLFSFCHAGPDQQMCDKRIAACSG